MFDAEAKMENQNHRGKIQRVAIEIIFWAAALAVVIFVNISPQALKTVNPLFLILFLAALLVIFSADFLNKIRKKQNKIFFSAIVYTVIFFAIFLFFRGAERLLIYYYLPVAIALSMAFLVIARPRSSVTILIAVCTFFLGEAFWNVQIIDGKKLFLHAAFLRVYSLTLVTIFSYYLYSRELKQRLELKFLNRRLEIVDNMKSEFVADVSHELRTPLTSIKNACALLRKQKPLPTGVSIEELLGIIDFNVDRQSRLIDSLLDLAKIEKGQLTASRSLIDIGVIARQVAVSLAVIARQKEINFQLKIAGDLPKIYASPDQISRVYANLLDNAIKYNQPGGSVFLEVSRDKGGVKSVVSDTGIGIKREDIYKLFDRFNRLETMLERKIKGTGLGLAITKQIIISHGGRIGVESQPGKGSKFTFIIPVGLRKIDKKSN